MCRHTTMYQQMYRGKTEGYYPPQSPQFLSRLLQTLGIPQGFVREAANTLCPTTIHLLIRSCMPAHFLSTFKFLTVYL